MQVVYELPEDIRRGLERARKRDLGRKNRLRVRMGEQEFRILRFWDGGFAMDAESAPPLRGFVDIYDGARQLYQCLVVCSAVEHGERIYEFKWQTPALTEAPVDFARDPDAPVALLG